MEGSPSANVHKICLNFAYATLMKVNTLLLWFIPKRSGIAQSNRSRWGP